MRLLARPLAVALLSASTLAFEILLVRVFAIQHFHHFAYMAIGVAMLGYGASGTLLALFPPRESRAAAWFRRTAIATPLALTASPALVERMQLDVTQLSWDAAGWPALAAVYLLLALPFAVGAAAVLLALTQAGERPGAIYGASFIGAGAGAASSVLVLWIFLPARTLSVPVLLAALGSLAAVAERGWSAKGRRLAAAAALGTMALAVAVLARPPWRLELTPYKELPQVEAFPDARRVAERPSPIGWVVAVDAPAFRHAPGLSLSYTGGFPRQRALFVDGSIAGAVSVWEDSSAMRVLDWLPSSIAYALGGRDRVLVIGAGGGTEIWTALRRGARRVVAAELHPDLVELTEASSGRLEEWEDGGRVEWAVGDARGYVARASERFDLIVIAPTGGFGSGVAGVHSLGADFLHTVEAYAAYLERLDEGGVLAVTRWLTIPPRESVRVILAAAEALRRFAPNGQADRIVVVRSWATATVLVKPSGFSTNEVEAFSEWARVRRFDLDWYPGIDAPASTFNLIDEPALFRAAQAGLAGSEAAEEFASAYAFDVEPARDARPYPHHFLRASSLRAFLSAGRGSWLPFAEWGYLALLATLAQSVLLAALFILLPATMRYSELGGRSGLALVGYFSALGLGYLAAEIAAIQQVTLLLGHPVYAVAAVLTAFLICSGAGSLWSDRLQAARAWRTAAALAALLTLNAAILLGLVHALQAWPLAIRAASALVLLAPLAFGLGMPFPLGLRSLARDAPSRVAWSWAANGFASVVAAPLSALIALEAGSRSLLAVAAIAYGAAAAVHALSVRR